MRNLFSLKTSIFVITFLITYFFCNNLLAQTELLPKRFAFEPELNYDNNIPTPAEILGYQLGEKFSVHAHVVDYFEKLAAASPKISIANYGETYEKKPLIYLVITSEKNQQQIETIRQNNLKLANPLGITPTEATQLMETQPVVISFSYSIHGNEASSTEAAMQVAYRLAAAQDPATQTMLENMVFIMYPCINPDGRDRYSYWYNSMQRSELATHPRDIEHYAPFPNGRTNHYWFDLNRDWVWGVHPESRGQTRVYQDWMPQVHTDYHEQGYNANYFTVPGTTPRNLLLPDQYEALADTIGRANIAAFDEHKISYFTREAFDFYYPGYGSSYPSVMGAIGMLTEQGGIGGGRAIETDDGYVLTIRQRIFDHYTTSIATLKKVAERRKIFLNYSFNAHHPKNSKSSTKAYIFPDDPNSYLYEVLKIMLHQGVQVQRAESSFSINSAKSYDGKIISNKTFPKGTFVISTNQPRHLFINSVLSPEMAIEDSVMYDMSTWAAPLAYNLKAYHTDNLLKINGINIKNPPQPPSGVQNPTAGYAFTIDWRQQGAPNALALLWKKGYRVRAAQKTFGNRKKNWSEGTLIILQGRNLEKSNNIIADMNEIAEKCQVVIDGHSTGRMLEGIDLASRNAKPIHQPKVAMLVEPPFSTYTSGQIYFLFDQATGLPVERIRTSILKQTDVTKYRIRYGGADLNDYDVLILPDASAGDLKKVFGRKGLAELRRWVSDGGVLIAAERAASYFTKEKSKLTDVSWTEVKKDSSTAAGLVKYKDREDYFGKKRVPGAALNSKIDNSNPLAFGMPETLFSLKFGTEGLKPNPNFQTVGYYVQDEKTLLASGYASAENLKHLSGKAFAGVQNVGSGKVVFFLDNTQYRMFWRGPSRMMQNAVMLLKNN